MPATPALSGHVVQNCLNDMWVDAEISHASRCGPAQIVKNPRLDLGGYIERGFDQPE